MSRIEPLLRNCLQHHVPHAVVYGRLLNGLGTVGSFWAVDSSAAGWRPEKQIHYVLGRVLPDLPPPSLDEEAMRSGVNNKTALEANQHRFSLMVPQQLQAPEGWYAHQVALAEQAAQIFAQASMKQLFVRVLTIPSSFPASGAKGTKIYTIQHFPLVLETKDGEVLWEHPEAEQMASGSRIAAVTTDLPRPATASPSPAPTSAPVQVQVKPPVAKPSLAAPSAPAQPATSTWFDLLKREVEEDCVPVENVQEVIRRRRIRFHRDSGLTDQAAEVKTDEEIKALQAPAPPAPTWYQTLIEEAQEDGVPEAKIQEVIRRRRIRFHRDSGLTDQAAEVKTDEEIKALQASTEPVATWYQELLQEVREDGVPEERIQDTVRRRRIRFHREGGLNDQDAEAKTDEELKALHAPAKPETTSRPDDTKAPASAKSGKTPKAPAEAAPGDEPATLSEPIKGIVKRTLRPKHQPVEGADAEATVTPLDQPQEKGEASQLISYILETGLERKDLAKSCGVSKTYLYMLLTERDGRQGKGLIPHLHLIKEAVDKGQPLPKPPVAGAEREDAPVAKSRSKSHKKKVVKGPSRANL